jgi:effector-binding domain-containing protein
MKFPCEIQQLAARPTLAIRFRAPVEDLPMQFRRVYDAIMAYLISIGEEHAGAAFAAYHNMDMKNLDVEAGFPVAQPLPAKGEIRPGTFPGGTYAVCHYTGPYNEIGPVYEDLRRFTERQGYRIGNVAYEWYLNGPDELPEALKTDLVMPVVRVSQPVHA